MISSKKNQLVFMFIAGFISMPLFASEPNKPKEPNKPAAELKFEIIDKFAQWLIENNKGSGPIRPEYMAELYIRNSHSISFGTGYGKFAELLQTSAGKSMSPVQKEFLDTSGSYEPSDQPFPDKPIGYVRIHLYAVSQDDAKKMARAFIEYVNENTQARIKEYKEQIRKWEEAVSQAKKKLAEVEPQLKETDEQYKMVKKDTHQFSSDNEAVDLAKKTIVEMDKTFNDLDIELAGIQERIRTIKDYQNKERQRPELQAKLDSMYIDLMIELNGLEARKKVAKEISRREQNFLSRFNKLTELGKEAGELSRTIADNQRGIEEAAKRFNLPRPEFIPADIYKDTVTIYAVARN